MSTEEFELLIAKNRPHEVFKLDWNNYYSLDFADTFLPKINPYRETGLYLFDGASLFTSIGISEKKILSLTNDDSLITNIGYTYPKGVLAENRKDRIDVTSNEVISFMEIDQDDNIDVFFKFGTNFKTFLSNYLKDTNRNESVDALESTVYKTNTNEVQSFFQDGLVQYTMMQFVLNNIGVEVELLESLNDFFNLKFEEPLVFLDDIEEEECEDGFLEKLTKILPTRNVPPQNLDCEVNFYRSEDQLNGKSGVFDTGYQGGFGFDRYDEKLNGKGQLSVKYFPIINIIDKEYRAPFLCLWPTKTDVFNLTKTSLKFTPISKSIIWIKITQGDGKDFSKSVGNLYYETGSSKLLINGKEKGNLFKDIASTPFNIGDEFSIEVKCTGIINDYSFVIFRETNSSGKIVGILNIVPNNAIFTTTVNLIDVKLSSSTSLKNVNKEHPLTKPLFDFFNQNSFNQALINININPNYQTLQINRRLLDKTRIDNYGSVYLPSSVKESFHNEVISTYNNELVITEGNKEAQKIADLKKIIDRIDVSPIKNDLSKKKKDVAKEALRLINLLIKKFKKLKGKENRFNKTYSDEDVVKEINSYKLKRNIYRIALYDEVIRTIQINKNFAKKYKGYEKKIEESILNNKPITNTVSSISANTINNIYMFLHDYVESFKNDPSVKKGGIAGFTTTGDGYVHMLDLALSHKTKKEELIAHELGHSLGLKHIFEYNEKDIKKEFDSSIKKLEQKKEKDLKNLVKNKGKENIALRSIYKQVEKTFIIIKKEIEAFKKNKDLKSLDTWISEQNTNIYIEVEDKRSITNTGKSYIENEFSRKKKLAEQKRDKELEKTLNLKQSSTKENFMDYDISKRKNFWYWQWREMYCNSSPLKKNSK